MAEWKKTACTMCASLCGLEMLVEGDQILSVRPDKDNPITQGYCCRKGRTAKYFNNHKDRLDYPLKKVGDHFERISWEQATKEIAERVTASVKQYGGKTVAECIGTAGGQGDAVFLSGLLDALGSNYTYSAIGAEFISNWWAHGKFFGDQLHSTEPDDENCEALLYWGSNSYVAHNYIQGRRVIREASQNPDKLLIVIDPRLSETARMADLHIMPRPGGDALLLRGLIALIIDKGWQHQDWINQYTTGWAQVLPWFKGFDYRAAFEVCNVSLEQMEQFARILTTKRWGVHQDLGLYFNRNSTLSSYLVLMLQVICGVTFVKGGAIMLPNIIAKGSSTFEDDPNTVCAVTTKRFPVLGNLPENILSYEILSDEPEHLRTLFVSRSNPIRSYPDTKKMTEAFEALDLLVVSDIAWTETCELADYVLPALSAYETYDFNSFYLTFPKIGFQMRRPILPPKAERREPSDIWIDIMYATGLVQRPPESLYQAAEKAVETGDRMPFFFKAMFYMIKNKLSMPVFTAILGDVMGRAMGSSTMALIWGGFLTSPLAGTGQLERFGVQPLGHHPIMEKIPKLKDFFVMDAAFQKVLDHPEGALLAIADFETMFQRHVHHKDKKVHLWCQTIEDNIDTLLPEKEAAALAPTEEFPLLLSSGRRVDVGVNWVMRNTPEINRYRDPYRLSVNPKDAEKYDLHDGEVVRVVSKVGELTIPVEIDIQMAEGYLMMPHNFGMKFEGKTYGMAANLLTAREDFDPIIGNAYFRYVPIRVEKLGGRTK